MWDRGVEMSVYSGASVFYQRNAGNAETKNLIQFLNVKKKVVFRNVLTPPM